MVLLKSQHFCEAVCGKLLVFGRYLANGARLQPNNTANQQDSVYGLWMLDLDTLEWERQECNTNFDVGGWNYFTVISELAGEDGPAQVANNNLLFLGNTDPLRQQGYDHFRDALVVNGESLGLYDISPPQYSHEFAQLLNNPELSDFVIVPANGQELHVHQVILITRWPHFRNIYKSGMIEAQQRRMEIPEPYEVVLAFLKYLYSDRLDENESWEVICEVLVIANMYLLNRLKKVCCERLYRHHMTVESCGTIFEKAIMAEEMGLKMLALDYMFRNYGSVLKSDVLLQMPPIVRQEFLEAVPDEAVLEVSQPRSMMGRSSPTKCPTSILTHHSSQQAHLHQQAHQQAVQAASTQTVQAAGASGTPSMHGPIMIGSGNGQSLAYAHIHGQQSLGYSGAAVSAHRRISSSLY